MKNSEKWLPSKFVYKKGRLTASRDPNELQISSRLVATLVARSYDTYIKDHVTGRLIDLGCGKVPLFEAYKNYVTDNICIDWGNSIHKNQYLDFECDLTKILPFENESFETVILSDVLEHVYQPETLWKEMSRILSNHGKILMNVPFYYGIHEVPHDYYRYTEYALRRFAEDAGLKIIVLKSYGGAPEIITDIIAKNLRRLPRIVGRPLAIYLQQFTLFFINTKFGKKVSEATSETFPLGYFLIAEKNLG